MMIEPRRLEHDDDALVLKFRPDGSPTRDVFCSCGAGLSFQGSCVHEAADWANDEGWRLADDGTAMCPRCVARFDADDRRQAEEDWTREVPR